MFPALCQQVTGGTLKESIYYYKIFGTHGKYAIYLNPAWVQV